MPHCIIEYDRGLAEQVAIETVLDTVHKTVMASPLFLPENVHSRLLPYDLLRLPEKEGKTPAHLLHVNIRLFAGRTEAELRQLSEQVVNALLPLVPAGCKVICECALIDKATMVNVVK